jgi:hypothetical protein
MAMTLVRAHGNLADGHLAFDVITRAELAAGNRFYDHLDRGGQYVPAGASAEVAG